MQWHLVLIVPNRLSRHHKNTESQRSWANERSSRYAMAKVLLRALCVAALNTRGSFVRRRQEGSVLCVDLVLILRVCVLNAIDPDPKSESTQHKLLPA